MDNDIAWGKILLEKHDQVMRQMMEKKEETPCKDIILELVKQFFLGLQRLPEERFKQLLQEKEWGNRIIINYPNEFQGKCVMFRLNVEDRKW